MNVRSTEPRYEILVRGSLSERLLGAFPTLTHEVRAGHTALLGTLPDPAALYGVLEQLECLGIELLEVRSLDPSASDDDVSPR